MAKQSEALEWKVLLSDAEWDRQESLDDLLGDTAAKAAEQKRRASRLWTTALTALLMIGIGAWMLYRQAEAGAEKIEVEVASAAATEAAAAWRAEMNQETANPGEDGPQIEFLEEIGESATLGWRQPTADRQSLPGWHGEASLEDMAPAGTGDAPPQKVDVGVVSLRTGLAMVEVTATDAAGYAVRETQFYLEQHLPNGDTNWKRTSPNESFWGVEQHFETTYFHFWYRIKDVEAVEYVAARLDTIYEQLRADVGLPFGQDRLEVVVLPALPSKIGFLEFKKGELKVASPKLLRIPVEMSDGAALLKSIVHPLATHVTSEAIQQGELRREWTAMVRGLQIWQIYAGGGLAEPELQGKWYRETAAWLDDDAAAIRNGQREASSDDLRILCREYDTWGHVLPFDLSLPAICMDERWEATIHYFLPQTPERLGDLLYRVDWDAYPGDAVFGDWVRSVAAATVVDYAVETYGRDSLLGLMEGFRTHEKWETLIPAVFGVSAEEFEAGWREFRQARYTVPVRE